MTRTREAPTPFTPEEEAAERAYIAEYVSDPRLGRWLATLDAARTGGGAFTRDLRAEALSAENKRLRARLGQIIDALGPLP